MRALIQTFHPNPDKIVSALDSTQVDVNVYIFLKFARENRHLKHFNSPSRRNW